MEPAPDSAEVEAEATRMAGRAAADLNSALCDHLVQH
jgi:hypothetical protein